MNNEIISRENKSLQKNLTEKQIAEFEEITSGLNINDPGTILSYGSELRNVAEQAADSLLETTKVSDSGDIGSSLNSLLTKLGAVKLENPGRSSRWKRQLCKYVPFIKPLVINYNKMVSQFESVSHTFDNIKNDVEVIKLETIEANNSLKVMYESSESFREELDKLIEAGEYKLEKFKEELGKYDTSSSEYQSLSMFCKSLERDIQTKKSQSFSLTNTMKLIIIMSGDNQMVCQKADRILTVTIPDMKNQANVGLRAIKLKYCSDVIGSIDETADRLMKETTNSVHDVSIKLARQSNDEDISTSSLLESMRKTSETVQEMIRIFNEDNNKTKENIRLLEEEKKKLDKSIISTKQSRIENYDNV